MKTGNSLQRGRGNEPAIQTSAHRLKRALGNGSAGENGDSRDGLRDSLAVWKLTAEIARYQGQTWVNWHQWWPQFVLAPTYNSQEIMSRWVIGRQVNIYKSSDPALEDMIRNNVAGYGSQLGTVLDYLELVQKKLRLPPKAPVIKLKALIGQIKDAKRLAGRV